MTLGELLNLVIDHPAPMTPITLTWAPLGNMSMNRLADITIGALQGGGYDTMAEQLLDDLSKAETPEDTLHAIMSLIRIELDLGIEVGIGMLHRDQHGEPVPTDDIARLQELQEGDSVSLADKDGKNKTYVINEITSDLFRMRNFADGKGHESVTLRLGEMYDRKAVLVATKEQRLERQRQRADSKKREAEAYHEFMRKQAEAAAALSGVAGGTSKAAQEKSKKKGFFGL